MRIEDLNGPRIKSNMIDETLDILQWLGIEWDGDAQIQSEGIQHSRAALDTLILNDAAYHCNLSRKEIAGATLAPHDYSHVEKVSYRPKNIRQHNLYAKNSDTNWRFIVNKQKHLIQDQLCGEIELSLDQDFIVWTKQGTPSYQLAVVVDDYRQGITDVIRGNDLLKSAAWQELIYRSLGWDAPRWHHLPLILGPDGNRLAKRHGDTRLITYREQGISPERIIGMIANWCNIQNDKTNMDADTFKQELDPLKIGSHDIIFSEKDEQWLTA